MNEELATVILEFWASKWAQLAALCAAAIIIYRMAGAIVDSCSWVEAKKRQAKARAELMELQLEFVKKKGADEETEE